MDINKYINAFERLYQKAKGFELALPDGVLAYRLLKSANLSSEHEQLAKATLPSLTYDNMKKQLKKIFNKVSTSSLPILVKIEPAYKSTHDEAGAYYTQGGSSSSFRGGFHDEAGAYYTQGNNTNSFRGGFQCGKRRSINNRGYYSNRGSSQPAKGA